MKFSVDVELVVLKGVEKAPPVYFNPLGVNDHKLVVMKFNLVIDPIKTHHVQTMGHGNICPSLPEITMPSKPDGSCLFNSILMILTGMDIYSAIFRHMVCNYISNPVKYCNLEMTYHLLSKQGRSTL